MVDLQEVHVPGDRPEVLRPAVPESVLHPEQGPLHRALRLISISFTHNFCISSIPTNNKQLYNKRFFDIFSIYSPGIVKNFKKCSCFLVYRQFIKTVC